MEWTSPGELTVLYPEYETLWSLETEVAVGWWTGDRSRGLASYAKGRTGHWASGAAGADRRGRSLAVRAGTSAGLLPLLLLFCAAALPLAGREKGKLAYGEGLIVSVPLPTSEVEQVVEDVAQNGVIRGTK